jgi:GTPase SAR1 family protein
MRDETKLTGKSKPQGQSLEQPGEPGWEPVPGVRLRLTLRGHKDVVGRIAWSPDGRRLASPSADKTIRIWNAVTCAVVRTLEGHTEDVLSVAWSPDGRRLASASSDKTVRLWDAETGKVLRKFEGHSRTVWSVAWSPDGRRLASASGDKMVRRWDAETGQVLRTLEGHSNGVTCVAWSPDGRRLASASFDKTVRLWDAETGQALRTLEGHSGGPMDVFSVAWWPEAGVQRLASASLDKTVRIWDAETGQATNVLEGHTSGTQCVAISRDAVIVASKGSDNTIRLWRSDTWQPVAVIPEPASSMWPPGVAFHPHEPLLATVGSDPGTESREADRLIHIWELDYAVLLGRGAGFQPAGKQLDRQGGGLPHEAVLHATAKIVLVGDSGVGKTGLGWRLAKGEFKEHATTHGQQFWVLDQLQAQRTDGTRCEAVLWDLAGQPDYRLIHALHVADADLALILFDPTHARDPLGSVHYWLGQLPAECPKILVPARIDRGSPTLTRAELDQFCRDRRIGGGFVETSAAKDIGLDELLARMKAQIPWDRKTAVTTTATFKRIKDFVLSLKEARNGQRVIVTPPELRALLECGDSSPLSAGDLSPSNKQVRAKVRKPLKRGSALPTSRQSTESGDESPHSKFTDAEMLTAVERVASHGFVRLLRTSDGQQRILLVPELLNNLAASFILEARRNPKGLGAIEEQKILNDEYHFPELEGLSREDHDLLIDATVSAFLENRLSYRCFREEAGQTRLLVFPELMNLKKPPKDDGPLVDDLSYAVRGATENLYAALVVTLGYTNTFQRSDQWHNQVRYDYQPGLVCGFRRQEEEDGETSYTLFYSANAGDAVKKLFTCLFESLLARKAEQQQLVKVLRFAPVACPCGTRVAQAQVRQRLAEKKSFVFCGECGERLALAPADVPIQLTLAVKQQVSAEEATANQRAVFEEAIYMLESRARSEGLKPKSCFLSYAWGSHIAGWSNGRIEPWALRLAADLKKAGHDVILDQTHNEGFGRSITRFVEEIAECDFAIVLGTPLYLTKYKNRGKEKGTVVAAEMDLIAERLRGTEEQKQSVIGLLLDGKSEESLAPLLRGRTYADFRKEGDYFAVAFDLMLSLYGIGFTAPGIAEWRERLRSGRQMG